MSRRRIASVVVGLGAIVVGCASAQPDSSDDVASSTAPLSANCPENRDFSTWPGPASWAKKFGKPVACVASRYDCGVPGADRRFENPKADDQEWPIAHDTPIRDGRGNVLATVPDSITSVKVNFGQTKMLLGVRHVYAFAVNNTTSGWVPAACIGWNGTTRPSASCVDQAGDVPDDFPSITGRKPPSGSASTAKYEIAATTDLFGGADLTKAKIVCNADGSSAHRSLADYMPARRSDGSYTINLILALPGMSPALGGTAADTFRVAHREGSTLVSDHVAFYRLTKVRSVPVYLFAADSSSGAFGQSEPRTVFVYGYVVYGAGKNGGAPYRRRYGWVDYQALVKP